MRQRYGAVRIRQELRKRGWYCSKKRVERLKRRPLGGLIMHSDRGVQYAATDYQQLLTGWPITPSMSRRGNCHDNAVSESFFATLKSELVHREQYRTREQAHASIFEYMEVFYNRKRLHSRLGYCSPVEFEQDSLSMNLCPL